MQDRTIIAVGGFASEVGKTTLLCDLLQAVPGWEAIKMTRGHYRSCGKDPHSCCVSHLLGNEPVVRSGREQTYSPGKDTGRYWDAGASNVHWVIVSDEQVEQGIKQALKLVTAPGVFVEGTSFTQYVDVDFLLMVARANGGTIKSSARRALERATALYVYDANCEGHLARQRFGSWLKESRAASLIGVLPIFTRDDLPQLVTRIRAIHLGHRNRSKDSAVPW
jgi:hypothetical protein